MNTTDLNALMESVISEAYVKIPHSYRAESNHIVHVDSTPEILKSHGLDTIEKDGEYGEPIAFHNKQHGHVIHVYQSGYDRQTKTPILSVRGAAHRGKITPKDVVARFAKKFGTIHQPKKWKTIK